MTWYPYVPHLFLVCAALKVLSKSEDGCSGFALIAALPSMAMALVRVAMEIRGAPKQLQSFASLIISAYVVTATTGLMALNNPCTISMGPGWTTSAAGNAAFVTLITAMLMAITRPCTMQHLAPLCVIVGPFEFVTFYIWAQKRHGGLRFSSYPSHSVQLSIIIAAAKTATLLVGGAVCPLPTRTREHDGLPQICQAAPQALKGTGE